MFCGTTNHRSPEILGLQRGHEAEESRSPRCLPPEDPTALSKPTQDHLRLNVAAGNIIIIISYRSFFHSSFDKMAGSISNNVQGRVLCWPRQLRPPCCRTLNCLALPRFAAQRGISALP